MLVLFVLSLDCRERASIPAIKYNVLIHLSCMYPVIFLFLKKEFLIFNFANNKTVLGNYKIELVLLIHS